MKKKSPKPYPTVYILLIAQDFWQARCQILLTNLLKEFIELNENTDMIINTFNHVELKMI